MRVNSLKYLLPIAILLISCNNSKQSDGLEELKAQYDFAIKDTAAITRIVIRDKKPSEVLLERSSQGWLVNGVFPVRKDAIEVLLETLGNVTLKTLLLKAQFQQSINARMFTESGLRFIAVTNWSRITSWERKLLICLELITVWWIPNYPFPYISKGLTAI